MNISNEKNANKLLLFTCFLVYTVSYFGKYSYSANILNVISDLQITKAYAGYVSSAFFFCYGIGQFINGIICKRLDSRRIVTLSMCLFAIITFTMVVLKNVFLMSVLWGLNGLFLSTLWCTYSFRKKIEN